MVCLCTLTELPNGQWQARHRGTTLGVVEVMAASKNEVQIKLRNELQYRIELCPCSGASGDTVVLEVIEER